MGKVRIVTDSTADIPQELIEEFGIVVVPLKVSFGTRVFRDGVDITAKELINRMVEEEDIPATSQPSPGEFVAVYESILAKGDSIISIHLSGKLSGTVQSARTAKTMTDSCDIYIFDSKSASLGLGLTVIAAARLAKEDKPLRDIIALVKKKIEKSFILFLVDTLDYLEKGGRIGKANALLGALLKIKPILTLDEAGQIIALEKVRGKHNAVQRMAQIIAEKTDESKSYRCALLYGNDYSGMLKLQERLQPVIRCDNWMINELGTVIISHTGPGLIGVAVSPE